MKKYVLLVLSGFLLMQTEATPQKKSNDNAKVRTSLSAIAEREVARRQEDVYTAIEAAGRGNKALSEKDYAKAVTELQTALNTLPQAPVTEEKRAAFTETFIEASIQLAEQRKEEGNYGESRALLEGVLLLDPDNKKAKKHLAWLDDPERTPPGMTPELVKDRLEVERLLMEGESFYKLGMYDRSEDKLWEVLRIDPYNIAASRLLEKVEQTRTDYYTAAYDHTRARMLRMVDETWKTRAPLVRVAGSSDDYPGGGIDNREAIIDKLNSMKITVQFNEKTLTSAIDFLRDKSKEIDPTGEGINFITPPEEDLAELPLIDLKLTEVTMYQLLDAITDMVNMRFKVGEYAVNILRPSAAGGEVRRKQYRVPPTFLSLGSGQDEDEDDFGDDDDDGPGLRRNKTAKEVLEDWGVTLADNENVVFLQNSGTLIVNATQQKLDLIETIVSQMIGQSPKQVRISTKFVEVSQANNEELGFDWLLGQFDVPASDRIFASGGTTGNQSALVPEDYPFTLPSVPGTVATPVGSNPVTSGLRSGRNAIRGNAIDGLLADAAGVGVTSTAPAIFALSGVFTDPDFQVALRALSQHRGTDLMTAPSIVTQSGEIAKIEVVREFIYPETYAAPTIPNEFTGGGDSATSFPVTPATPEDFATREVGVLLEVTPTIGSDNYTMSIKLAPSVVEFEGFINYGSPIQSSGTDALGQPVSVTITDNRIEQPVFSTRKVDTLVQVYDGATVFFGGLMREDVQQVEDKVPLLGDIPWIGRLFQSKAESHLKRNLMIFVTAEIIDPSGRPVSHYDRRNQLDSSDELGHDDMPLP